jgi:hypothetical protein
MGVMDTILQSAVVSALVSIVIALAAAYPMARITAEVEAKRDRRAEFRSRLQDILTLAVEHPHLEQKQFCDGWRSRESSDQKYWQYDIYCCMLFNLIEDVWKHTGGKPEPMDEIVAYEEWFVCHRDWWTDNQQPNSSGYNLDFYKFVEVVVQAHNNTQQGVQS